MRKMVIFGTGKIAECAYLFFSKNHKYKICAFCCDEKYIKTKTFKNLPIVAFQNIEKKYPPNEYSLFVAIGYHNLNRLREIKFYEAKRKGYILPTYIDSDLQVKVFPGQNTMILDGCIIQPEVKVGNNVFIWGGAMIGHHSVIKSHSWITGGANVGGISTIGKGCFLGLNSTIGQGVKIGSGCLIGANTLTTRNLRRQSVVVNSDTPIHRLNTKHFEKITSSFNYYEK